MSCKGQGIATLLGKSADQEDGGLLSQRTILPELEFSFFYTKRGGSKVKHFLVLVSLQKGCVNVCLPAQVDLVRRFPVS